MQPSGLNGLGYLDAGREALQKIGPLYGACPSGRLVQERISGTSFFLSALKNYKSERSVPEGASSHT